jgi:hypothetical protein
MRLAKSKMALMVERGNVPYAICHDATRSKSAGTDVISQDDVPIHML